MTTWAIVRQASLPQIRRQDTWCLTELQIPWTLTSNPSKKSSQKIQCGSQHRSLAKSNRHNNTVSQTIRPNYPTISSNPTQWYQVSSFPKHPTIIVTISFFHHISKAWTQLVTLSSRYNRWWLQRRWVIQTREELLWILIQISHL